MSNEVTVTIRGNAGEQPELRTGGLKPFVRLSVATTPRRRQDDGWVDGPTQWYQVKAWGEFAENIAATVRRGDAVIATGPLRIEEYTTEDGVTYKSAVILANAFGMDLRRARAQVTKTRPARAGDPDAERPDRFGHGNASAYGEGAGEGDAGVGAAEDPVEEDVSSTWAAAAESAEDAVRAEEMPVG